MRVCEIYIFDARYITGIVKPSEPRKHLRFIYSLSQLPTIKVSKNLHLFQIRVATKILDENEVHIFIDNETRGFFASKNVVFWGVLR